MRHPWHPALRATDLWRDARRRTVVFFNALSLSPGGSQSVLSNYWREFIQKRPDWRLVILRGPASPDLDEDLGPTACSVHLGPDVISVWGRTWWEKRWMGRTCESLGADVYFGPNGVFQRWVTIPQCLLIQDPTPYVIPAADLLQYVRATLLKRNWVRGVRRAACMGYTSHYMRNLVLSSSGGWCERRCLIAYNGIDESMRRRARQEPRPREQRERYVLTVSTFVPHKNFETLIRALAILRGDERFGDFRLRIVGRNIRTSEYAAKISADYIAALRGLIRALGLDQAVSLECDLPWSGVSDAYDRAMLFSLTSLCESFGIPAIEAMAHGAPTVLGDCCAVPEVGGDACLLVPPRDADALAAAMKRVLSEPDRYARMQALGRARCLEFSWSNTVSAWIEVIEEVLAAARARIVERGPRLMPQAVRT